MPLSQARESYLIAYLEGDIVAEVIKTRALINSQLCAINPKLAEQSLDAFKDYIQILLPSVEKLGKMEKMNKEDNLILRETLKKARVNRPHSKPKK